MAKSSQGLNIEAFQEELSHALEENNQNHTREEAELERDEEQEADERAMVNDTIAPATTGITASEAISITDIEAIPNHARAQSADLSGAIQSCQTGVMELTEYRLRLIDNMHAIDGEVRRLQELYGKYRQRVYEVERRERDMQQDMLDLLVTKRRLDSPK